MVHSLKDFVTSWNSTPWLWWDRNQSFHTHMKTKQTNKKSRCKFHSNYHIEKLEIRKAESLNCPSTWAFWIAFPPFFTSCLVQPHFDTLLARGFAHRFPGSLLQLQFPWCNAFGNSSYNFFTNQNKVKAWKKEKTHCKRSKCIKS